MHGKEEELKEGRAGVVKEIKGVAEWIGRNMRDMFKEGKRGDDD